MKKKNALIMSALSISLVGAIALPSAIFADTDTTSVSTPAVEVTQPSDSNTPAVEVTQPSDSKTPDDHVVTPQVSVDGADFNISGGASPQGTINVPKGYGHIKLKFQNNTGHSVKISLTHDESNKNYFDSFVVGPHDTEIWKSTSKFSSGVRSGSYTLQFRGGDNKVDVHVWGVFATESYDI